MNRKRHSPPPARGPFTGWTVQRAAIAGIGLGLAALLVSAFVESRATLLVYAGLLILTLLCGVSILLILLRDVHARQRGDRVRPIRIFDLAMGVLLALPAGYGLWRVWPLLGL
ncbi:MAG TPA: hypothetical protein VMG08_15760 [Allosphingosinicella sp.]|nr:hypothetical protein [Allosphingosinicella sp.]